MDKLIAATALIHDLTVVTRNHSDFARIGLGVLESVLLGCAISPDRYKMAESSYASFLYEARRSGGSKAGCRHRR